MSAVNNSAPNAGQAQGQFSSDISIVNPPRGATFAPGAVIPIEVRVTASHTVSAMAVVSPLGFGNELRKSAPWSFTLTVPTDQAGLSSSLLGEQPIYVDATVDGEKGSIETGTTIDVEEPGPPVKLSSQWTQLFFEAGERGGIPLLVLGTFKDELELDVSHSTHISFTSSDPRVASVSSEGIVSPIGPGKTVVEARYDGDVATRLVIPVACAGSSPSAEPPAPLNH